MNATRPFRGLKRDRAAQRGSMVVTVFVILACLMLVVGGLNVFLQQQIRQSTDIQRISLAKLQTLYLAEMGVNQVMYYANQGTHVALADPFPVVDGASVQYDFQPNVAMVRGVSGAGAICVVSRTGASNFRVDATLTVPNVGTFTRAVTFVTAKPATQWVLSTYTIL